MSTLKNVGKSRRLFRLLKSSAWMLIVGIASVAKVLFIFIDGMLAGGNRDDNNRHDNEEESYYQKSVRMQLDDVYSHNLYHGEDIYNNDNLN